MTPSARPKAATSRRSRRRVAPRTPGRQDSAAGSARAEPEAQQRRARPRPTSSNSVAASAAPNWTDVAPARTSATGGTRPRAVRQGLSRRPVRNSHELHATTPAASAPVTASESPTLTSLVPRKP